MMSLPVDVAVSRNNSGDLGGDFETVTGEKMAETGVTWEATIMINATGNQQRVRVEAVRQSDAKQLIEMLYKDARLLFGPVRVDLTRAV
jgi:hypothetical protein